MKLERPRILQRRSRKAPRATPRKPACPVPAPCSPRSNTLRHGWSAAGSSGSDADIGDGMARPIVIPILIAIPWLTVVTATIGFCRVAARADAAEVVM